jgi:hypothetical protein
LPVVLGNARLNTSIRRGSGQIACSHGIDELRRSLVRSIDNTDRLRNKISLVLPLLSEAGNELTQHPKIKTLYPEYLFFLHSLMRASVSLMDAALARAKSLADSDPVSEMMVPYLTKHIPEERGHDEWVLEDLEALGLSRSAYLCRPPSHIAAEIVGSQYYWILHYHPVVLFGFMEIAEGYPPRVANLNSLLKRTGYPKDAFRALYRHARLDLKHRKELHEVFNELPLTPEQTTVVGISAIRTITLTSYALQEIVDRQTV